MTDRSPSAGSAAHGNPVREHMRSWAQRLASGDLQRDPVEDTADEVWRSLRVFAVEYLDLTSENARLRALTVDDPTSIYHEHERLRQIIERHDADRELGRCDGLLMPDGAPHTDGSRVQREGD